MFDPLFGSGSVGGSSRMSCGRVCAAVSVMAVPAHAQPTSSADEPPKEPPPFQLLRYAEDYSYLRDPAARTGNLLSLEPIKYIPLNAAGDWYLSIGGEIRQRYEYYHDLGFGAIPDDPGGFLLQRYVLHGDLHLGPSFRAFVQPRAAVASFMEGPLVPAQEDGFDVQQAFVDLGTDETNRRGPRTLAVRVGRQEMSYGSERLVSVREATNVRRAFDAVRLLAEFERWQADAFVSRLVVNEPRRFDPWGTAGTTFWGVHATGPVWRTVGLNLDVYYLGVDRGEASFEQGTAGELRHTTGMRLFGAVGGLDYDFEGMFQWGRFGATQIIAWALGSATGYTFEGVPLTPRVALLANVVSGDRDPDDERLGTFNPLFPRGNYFGESAIAGPVNLFDVHPTIRMQWLDTLSLEAGWTFFWRYSDGDGFYDNGLALVQPAGDSRKRRIGSELSFVVDWKLGRHLSARTSYSRFFAGPFLEDTGPGEDVDALIIVATYLF